MKKFLVKLFIFIAIFLVLDRLSLFFIYCMPVPDFNIKSSDLIIIGCSHGASAFDPDIFTKAGLKANNYCRGGHYSELQYYFYRCYRKHYKAPRAMLISIPYFCFKNDSRFERLPFLYRGRDLREIIREDCLSFDIMLCKYKDDFVQFYHRIISALKSPKNEKYREFKESDIGYSVNSIPKFKDKDLSMEKDPAKFQRDKRDYIADAYSKNDNPRNLSFFRRLMNILHRDHVQVFLVETPEFSGSATLIKNKDKFYREIEEEIKDYPNVTFIKGYESGCIDEKNPENFFDGGLNTHLSYRASRKYSKETAQKILRKLKASQSLSTSRSPASTSAVTD